LVKGDREGFPKGEEKERGANAPLGLPPILIQYIDHCDNSVYDMAKCILMLLKYRMKIQNNGEN